MPPRRKAKPRSAAHAALGEAVEELRKAAGLTQEGLAERVGTEFNRIGELERGATDARFSTLLRVARGLDVGLDEIAGRFERILRESDKGRSRRESG
ncbi:MAG TPA: helix-turn-helix transcriptional regulator [Solirubrobacterales bacterium]